MQHSTEFVALIVGVIGLNILLLLLRFTHFEKVIEEQIGKIQAWSTEIKTSIGDEIKKGKEASVEAVINQVTVLSAVEGKSKRLDVIRIGMRRGFILDFATIGLLIILALALTIQDQPDIYTVIFLIIVIMAVFAGISAFISLVKEFDGIKENIRIKKTPPNEE